MGRKNLGGVSLKNYMRAYKDGNTQMWFKISEAHIRTDDAMREIIPKDVFIDISEITCGTSGFCTNITDEGLLISYDSTHLTAAGATLMGERLLERLK